MAALETQGEARLPTVEDSADGQFRYAITTTGIYCRPSCPSRTANPKNVSLHVTPGLGQGRGFSGLQAVQAGRGRRDAGFAGRRKRRTGGAACRLIESSEEPLSSPRCRGRGLSPSYFHRLFKARPA